MTAISAPASNRNTPERPAYLEAVRDLYPFESHWHDRGQGLRMHYLDEGAGTPVVMVHGNPTWSFYFRSLALALRSSHRVIVPDHIGCGLSDKPQDDEILPDTPTAPYEYTLERRVDDLESLLVALGITSNVTLVLHDWGGAIGMGWAARHPESVARIVLLNTAAFGLPPAKRFPGPLALARDWRFGGWLVRRFNAFSGIAARVGSKRGLEPRVRGALVGPYDSWASRIATLRFVQDIPLRPGDRAWSELQRIEAALPQFRDRPMMLGWGLRDFVFDVHFLREWQRRFPQAESHEFSKAGHYILEDEPESIAALVRDFIARHPLPGEPSA